MSHLPETAYDGHRAEHVHHAGQIANGTRVTVLDAQGTPCGSGVVTSYDPDDRRYRISLDSGYETYRYWDGFLPASPDCVTWSRADTRRPAAGPASLPPIGAHETLHRVPAHRVAVGPTGRRSIVELDAVESAVKAVLDAAGPLVTDLLVMDGPKAIDLDAWPAARALIDAHRALTAVQG
ncbi:hypothetical protein [Xylanimonas protaetiae]|uniref:Uncharacterized protein n=1 Tax=Xylanimonas protaetiae TaxID=2509457 RepID=A0A4V0YG55_9MICO|nr:hypothetical protein [Xylanimonas protaetiae]QAY70031.1 hypothetical protein ET471_08275 [Xylanimonas protaetiae]